MNDIECYTNASSFGESGHDEISTIKIEHNGILQWGESASNAIKVTLPLSLSSTTYLVFVGFKDFESSEVPRFAYMASINRTITGFMYGQATSVERVWFSICI